MTRPFLLYANLLAVLAQAESDVLDFAFHELGLRDCLTPLRRAETAKRRGGLKRELEQFVLLGKGERLLEKLTRLAEIAERFVACASLEPVQDFELRRQNSNVDRAAILLEQQLFAVSRRNLHEIERRGPARVLLLGRRREDE